MGILGIFSLDIASLFLCLCLYHLFASSPQSLGSCFLLSFVEHLLSTVGRRVMVYIQVFYVNIGQLDCIPFACYSVTLRRKRPQEMVP